ncbi:MAG: preprotein translocase subunit SecY, partial [Bacteroidales bacterium]
MKKLGSILKNKDIMSRILFTVLILFVFRIGAQITVPGVDTSGITKAVSTNSALSLMNLLGGGTLQTFSIFALGVSPYITAQIIIQLLAADVLPALSDLRRQGQHGRKKMEMANRYLTLMLGAVQAYGIIKTIENSTEVSLINAASGYEWLQYLYIIIVMLAGAMMVMWLGDQISVKGIGNGISMIIFAGIVCSLPSQISNAFALWVIDSMGISDAAQIAGTFEFILYILSFLLIIAFVTFIELSKRKIPVQHAGKGGGQTPSMARASFLPIKINPAGVIPVIFASSIMMAPSVVNAFLGGDSGAGWLDIFTSSKLTNMGNGAYMPWGLIIYIVLTFAFTYFYANVQINPQQMAENFQKNGSYIPGIRPGIETERYVRKVLNRVCFIGAIALAAIAALPSILSLTIFKDYTSLSYAIGGTGLIIVVGVALEINSQIDGLLAGKSFDEVVASGGQ